MSEPAPVVARSGLAVFLAGGAGWWQCRMVRAGRSGPLGAAQEQGGACPERDDAHSGGGHDLLGAVQGVAAAGMGIVAVGAGGALFLRRTKRA